MTHEQITEWGREANLPACHLTHPKALMRFANLVRNAAIEDAVDFARRHGMGNITCEAMEERLKS